MKQYYPLWSMARLSGRDSKPTDISGWAKYIGDQVDGQYFGHGKLFLGNKTFTGKFESGLMKEGNMAESKGVYKVKFDVVDDF